jgi:hypothetical protein
MKRIICHIICFGMVLVMPVLLQAQVLAKASVDRDKILIGEPIILTLDVHIPLGQSVIWFALDTIPHFEFLDRGSVDTSDGIDGKQIQQVIRITSFDSGHWQIPSLLLKVDDKTYATDTIPVDISYTPYNQADDYRDIKDIAQVAQPGWLRYIPLIIGLITLAAIGLIIYLVRKKKQVVTVEVPVYVSKLSPYEDALKALEELRNKGWVLNGEVKVFYSRLNDILRIFILRKLNIATLEKTNEELIRQLQQLSIDRESFHQLTTALRMTDFVKFAKYQPGAADNEKNFTIIHTAITTLNNIT